MAKLPISRRYETDKSEGQAKLNRLSRNFVDLITNDKDDHSIHRPKRRRTRHESPPGNSDEEIESSTRIASDERFVYQPGHKYFLLCAP
jgi:hypothetical protein